MSTENAKEPIITTHGLHTGARVLWRYIRIYRREIVFITILGVIAAVANATVPYIAGKFFDAIITPSHIQLFGRVWPLYAVLLALWAVIQLINSLMNWQINIRSENFSNTVWVDYWSAGISKILELPMAFHKAKKIGETEEKINRASGQLETIVGQIVIDLTPQFLSIFVVIAIGLTISYLLTLALIIGIVLYVIILLRTVRPIAELQREYQKNLFRAYGDSYELMGNVATVKQAVSEAYERNRILTLLKGPVLTLWNKMNFIWSNLSLAQAVIILATQLTIFIISIALITKGVITIGNLLAFNAYATMVFGPFVVVGRQWQTIQNGLVQLEEAEKILAEPSEQYAPAGGDIGELHGDVVFNHVSFAYEGNRPILQDVSFSVHAGQSVALVGESGVGKSTLIDLISGFHFPNTGEVLIDGRPTNTLNLKQLRQQIGVVPQEVVLFNDTIRNNIRYGSFSASDTEVHEAAKEAYAQDFILKFPDTWEQLVGERGVKLSVGQKQRVAIARAILRHPRILVLDEPTSALDAGSERAVTESLERLMKGKTTFIIAHRLSTVRRADLILVIKDGRIIESGSHEELLSKEEGEYRRLYELQIGLHA